MNFGITDPLRPDLGGNLHHGDDYTFCPELWQFLIDRFAVQSVLDVGCGQGHAVAWFQRAGVYTVGIDGLKANVDRAVTPIALHDLTAGPFYMPVNLVWSCEVAEHIDEQYVDNYLDTLANGDVVAMTHALPGQGGWHHVNCQPQEYWVRKMMDRGFIVSALNADYRNKTTSWTYFTQSGLVFLRNVV